MFTKLPIRFSNIRLQIMLLLVATIGLSSLGIGVRAKLTGRQTADSAVLPNEAAIVATQSRAPGTRLPSHLITILPGGFQPAEARWPKERFFLAIDNRSGVDDITLRVDREVGGRLKEVNLKMRRQRSAGVFDPPPGKYVLTEANHPGWVCHITISAH